MSKLKLNPSINTSNFSEKSNKEEQEVLTIKLVDFTSDTENPGYDLEVYINRVYDNQLSQSFDIKSLSLDEKTTCMLHVTRFLKENLNDLFYKIKL
jgi:hypothetical protein